MTVKLSQSRNSKSKNIDYKKITKERKSFQPLIEEAMAYETKFYVKYNKLIIDDKTYMYDYQTKSVQPIK